MRIEFPDSFGALYGIVREVSGVALVTGGLGFLIAPSRDYFTRRLGVFFFCAGFLFCLSAFDPSGRIPLDLGNLLLIAAFFLGCHALLDIMVYLLLDEPPPAVRWVLRVGIAWGAAVWILPFLDYLLGLVPIAVSVEDGASLAPIHYFASYALYLWPVAVVVATIRICRLDLRIIDFRKPGLKFFGVGTIAFGFVLVCAAVGIAAGSPLLYRVGHTLLEMLLLVWYFTVLANPGLSGKTRTAILAERERLLLLDPREAELVKSRVERAIGDSAIIRRTDLDLGGLAAIVKVPPYRLSNWFNAYENTTFPAWLNVQRIDLVKRLMIEHPDRNILDIAMEAGYASKSVFNEQFRKNVGMSPSEWRRSNKAHKNRQSPVRAAES